MKKQSWGNVSLGCWKGRGRDRGRGRERGSKAERINEKIKKNERAEVGNNREGEKEGEREID